MFKQDLIKDFNGIMSRYKFVNDTLNDYKELVQPESLIKSVFFPKAPEKFNVDIKGNAEIINDVEKRLLKIEPNVKQSLDKLNDCTDKINNNNALISNLKILPKVKAAIYNESDNLKVLTGISNASDLKKIESKLKKNAIVLKSKIDKSRVFLAIFSTPNLLSVVEKLLHEIGFDDIVFPYENKNPVEIIKRLKIDNNNYEKEIRNIKKELASYYNTYEKELIVLGEELEVVRKRTESLKNFKVSASFSILEAWVPANRFEDFKELVNDSAGNFYLEVEEREDAPTIYNNNPLFKPFEIVTNLYSAPKYNKFDPTTILAFTFTIFFGLMLTDFVYGVLMAVLAFLVYRGMGKYDKTAKHFSMILIYFGVSAAIWGIIFGSYFGDIIQRTVYADILATGGSIMLPLQLIDPMKDIMIGLGLAIVIGAIHLLIGLLVGFTENMADKKYLNAFMDQGVWMVFMLGSVVILGSFTRINFPFLILGLVLIGISVVMQVVLKFISAGPVLAVLSVFDFSGFFGDLFSYARLIALALGTSGIALGVNFMCLLIWDLFPEKTIVLSIVLMIPILIIFVLGHLFNILMNGLGAFVHTTRLHFLEHFSKYYEGEGIVYEPFHAERKKTIMTR